MVRRRKDLGEVEEEGLLLVEETGIEAVEAGAEIAEETELAEAIKEVPVEEKIEEPKPRMAKGDYYNKINGGN